MPPLLFSDTMMVVFSKHQPFSSCLEIVLTTAIETSSFREN